MELSQISARPTEGQADIDQANLEFGSTDRYPGFSARYNEILNLTGLFPPLDDGRLTAIARFFGSSKPGAMNWLSKDKPPTPKPFRKQINMLLEHIEGDYDVRRIEAWLLHGDVVPNPFMRKKYSESDHLIAACMYGAVAEVAKQRQNFDFYALPKEQVDRLYDKLLDHFTRNCLVNRDDLSNADWEIISAQLTLASNNYL